MTNICSLNLETKTFLNIAKLSIHSTKYSYPIQYPVSFLHLLGVGSVFINFLYFKIADLFRGSFRNIQMALLPLGKEYQVSFLTGSHRSYISLLIVDQVFVDLC